MGARPIVTHRNRSGMLMDYKVTFAVSAVIAPFAGTFLLSSGIRRLVRLGGVLSRNGLLETM